ncbi:MAG: FAD-dependent oxidoreductase [Desulfobacteraceae bacterium]|nr:FAD-dependent oxidoreductase [Desulfobacteraceae bacterium]MBC2754176.1 FAD-dependent oxidoreductase [Desulfobacteraceae bacterium]
MSLRIGCYICHCGINIAFKVRVEEVAEFARSLDDVAVSRDYKFMCSDPGQEMIEKDIKNFDLNRVVVASCSPRLHEKTFQATCKRAGLNPYMFQMASVREQVSWVTQNEDEATQKAKTLMAGAINRVKYHHELETRKVEVHPDVLVVGGGIAGMQAALDIGNAGHQTFLVEKSTTIGGHMLQFDKTFPTLDCAACIGTPKMVEVAQNDHIKLFSYSEVIDVSGYIGNYSVKILKKPRYIKESLCTGCGECTKACPVISPSEWDESLGDRKAIFRAFPQAVPITYCIDKKDRAPCVGACPAHVNVQGYIQLIKKKEYIKATQLIMEKIPLPGVLGRVCPHPCELECRRQELDKPVAIRDLKRFAADQMDMTTLAIPDIEDQTQKVAIIGSGPAGLTVAYDLRLKGYQVTVFEASKKTGGMLRLGIPDYRLPPEILDNEIGYIQRMGVDIRTKTRFGTDITLADLKKSGFSSVFLGIGAHGAISLGIPGEDLEGVIDAIRFLREVNLGDRTCPGNEVIVIGGGNVAIDAIRVAKRTGSKKLTLVYRRTEKEMPAYEDEILGAKEEGIEFLYLTSPVKVIEKQGKVVGLQCIKNKLGAPDASGRQRPEPIKGSEFIISCDTIITAIGQKINLLNDLTNNGLECTSSNNIISDPDTMQTSILHVFACGDAVTGAATVVQAIAGGHRAARGMHHFLAGRDMAALKNIDNSLQDVQMPHYKDIPKGSPIRKRQLLTHMDAQQRSACFDEVSKGLLPEQAIEESDRCLNCGECCECCECVSVCEANAIDHTMKGEIEEIKVGSIILATGYDVLDPGPIKQFGYGTYPNVYTSLEFERISNATGPTGGEILIRDNSLAFTREPESVALLHCIGSRDVNYHEYCSRVCCMYALKYSHLIKEKTGHDTKVYDFYIDMRCFGEGYEEFYRRCQEEGTHFIRGKASEITHVAQTPEEQDKLIVLAEDTLLGMPVRIPVDMVVLCVAMQAREDALDVGRIFGVNLGADGFFLEEHPKLGPLNTATDGVFIAGACQSPKDIPDTVAQASGAAAKALSLATRGQVLVPSTISWIDPDICAGCQICIDLCPYTAIEFDHRRQISVINEAVCKGCGSCSGFCPSGAAQVRHFQKKQIFAEFEGIMDAVNTVGI